MWFGDNKRVTLRENLTRYHAHLTIGATGTLLHGARVGPYGSQDNFGAVPFDCCGATLDILLVSLDIEGAAEERAARESQFCEDLRTTREAILHVGPRGGFRSLSITYSRGYLSIGFREEGLRVAGILRELGIKVEKRVEA